MTVSELIEELKKLNQDSKIYYFDSYWDDFNNFKINKIDETFYTLPNDATTTSYLIKKELADDHD